MPEGCSENDCQEASLLEKLAQNQPSQTGTPAKFTKATTSPRTGASEAIAQSTLHGGLATDH